MPSGADPLEPTGWGLFAQWHALIDRCDPRFTLLSTVQEVAEPLARLETTITTSMWNMQRHQTIQDLGDEAGIEASLRRKRVDTRMLLPRRVAERRCPLISTWDQGLRLVPVAHPLQIHDGRRVVVGDSTGDTVWTSTDRDVVARAVAFYERLWESAERAVPEGEEPPFTRRMVDIALRLVDGATDREIARSLGVSERTVSADIREMSTRLGARSRAHAIALLCGMDG